METVTKTETCVKCAYWNALADGEGECRRQPPQAVLFKVAEGVQFETRFPVTSESDWCGEYAAK